MLQSASVFLGIFLIIAGVVLAFLRRQAITTIFILFFGLALCLIPKPKGFGFKLPGGIEGNIEAQVSETTTDVAAQIAPMQLSIQKLEDALSKQEDFNKTIVSKLSAGTPDSHALPQTDINATSQKFAANSKYTVLVFYGSSREADAKNMLKSLTTAGFQASATETSFNEAPKLSGPGSSYIQPTENGTKILKDVEAIAMKSGLPQVQLGGAYPIKRGDIQVFLYDKG